MVMPIYEYVCQACGTEKELMQRISEPPATDCPDCGQPALTKQVSAAGFRLNGGGWYETDFKSGGKKNLVGDKADATAKADAPACTPTGCDKPACAAKPEAAA